MASRRPFSESGSVWSRWVLLVVSLACAPGMSAAEEAERSPLRAGAWAAEFEIDPDIRYDFGFSSGATISVKRHTSERAAFRVGVGARFDNAENNKTIEDRRISIYPPSYALTGSGDDVRESHGYQAFLYWVRHYAPLERVSMYWEMGPAFRYSQFRYTDSNFYPAYYGPAEEDIYSRSGVERGVTLDVNAGFEWFFTKRLSLGARYGASGGYSWGAEDSESEAFALDGSYYRLDRSFGKTHEVSAQTNGATVVMAAYF